jgi:hypothetical protein
MKNIITIIFVTAGLALSGCISEQGPMGPRGLEGPEGPQGEPGESGYIFEFENLNFTSPDYEIYLEYPNDFEGLASDVALVYLLWGVENIDGTDVEIWRQLPQTLLLDAGQLIYNYDFTLRDVRLFLNATFPLDNLTAVDTDEWVARVVVVPGNFWATARVDRNIGYFELIDALGLEHKTATVEAMQRR